MNQMDENMENEVEPGINLGVSAGAKPEYVRTKIFSSIVQR